MKKFVLGLWIVLAVTIYPGPQPARPLGVHVGATVAAAEQSQLQTVKTIRAKYPTPLGARHWEFLVEVAQATGAQLFEKLSGDKVFVPALNTSVSMDVIGRGALGDVWVDILGDAEGAAVPSWDAHAGAAGKYLDVSGITLPGAGTPPPSNPPPSNPPPTTSGAATADLQQQQLVALLQLVALQQKQIDALERQNAAIVQALTEIKATFAAGVKIRF